MKKSLIASALFLLPVLSLSLSGCASEEDKGEPIVVEADSYDMDGSAQSTTSKILSTVLEGARAGIGEGVSTVVASVGTWMVEGILKSLGFNYMGDNTFKSTVLDKLDEIDSQLASINGKLDELKEDFSNQNYISLYRSFYKNYQDLNKLIKSPYKSLLDCEQDIADGTATNVDAQIRDIATSVNESGSTLSEVGSLLSDLAHSIVGNANSLEALATDNILEILYRFAERQSLYLENQSALLLQAISEPFVTYFSGIELATINYSYMLDSYGIRKLYFAPAVTKDGSLSKTEVTVIGYETDSEDGKGTTAYLNCHLNEESQYRSLYGTYIASTALKDATSKKMNNVSANANIVSENLATTLSEYNQVVHLYNDFLSTNHLENLQDSNRTFHGKSTFQSVADSTVKTVWAKDVLQVSEISSNGDIGVNYDQFGNISKSDFVTFATDVYNVLKNDSLTFRGFFENEGFLFPTNNKANLLLLGAEKGLSDKDDYYNNGYKYKNSVALVSVDLNTKIKDFVKNNTFKKEYYSMYCTKQSVSSSCGPKFKEVWSLAEGSGEGGSSYLQSFTYQTRDLGTWNGMVSYDRPVKYYTIKGLSSHPKKGVVQRGSLSF